MEWRIYFRFIPAILFLIGHIAALHYSLHPPQNAFFLFSHSSTQINSSTQVLYLHDNCAHSTDQHLSVSAGGRTESTRLYTAVKNLNCAVSVKVVQESVKLDRPYIDVLALADLPLLSFFRQSVCVSVQVTSPTAATVSANCELTPFEEGKHTCLIRIQVPYLWFGGVGVNSTKKVLSLSHTVSTNCDAPFYDRPQTPVTLLPFVENAQAHTLQKDDNMDLSLLSRANLTFALNSLNSLFVHLAYNETKKNAMDEIELRAWIDSRFEVVNVSPLSPDEWHIRPVSAVRPRFYTSFICTRRNKTKNYEGYLFAILLKMRGSVVENRKLQLNEEGVEATFHWEIRRTLKGENVSQPDAHRVATKFRVTPDNIYAVVPVAKTTDLINVAVLSSTQSTVPMRVLSVSVGGATHDVTSLSHCISGESRVLKTSPTCTSVYVDGSELRGMVNVKVHVHFEKWTTSIPFTVWFPRLPITIWIRDPVLNAVESWPVTVWKPLDENQKGGAQQFSCTDRFQHTEIRILASFQVGDDRTGERLFLSGAREILFDVTSFAQDRVHSADRSIVTIKRLDGRLIANAAGRGSTRIIMKRSGMTPDIEYGSSPIMVTDEPVSVRGITVVPVVDLDPRIEKVQGRHYQYGIQTHIKTAFTTRYQHGSLSLHVVYSDDQSESLADIQNTDYILATHSSEERNLAIAHRQTNGVDLIALDDTSDVTIRVLLRSPPQCIDPDADALAESEIAVSVLFERDSNRGRAFDTFRDQNTTLAYPSPPTDGWRMESVLAIILIIVVVAAICRILSNRTRAFSGYEKLVAPLLSRLSSSSSGSGRDEDSKEWVWLSKAHIDSNSIGSRYSQKSTIHIPEQSSPSFDSNTQRSVSYRGSEISVFISPQPTVTVHPSGDRSMGGGSWRTGKTPRVRMTRNPMVDSNSDHNIARVVTRTGSWRGPSGMDNEWHNHTWNNKRRGTDYDGLRESVA